MTNLDFILWMILFPIAVSICSYIDALTNRVKGRLNRFSQEAERIDALVLFIVYIFVAIMLF